MDFDTIFASMGQFLDGDQAEDVQGLRKVLDLFCLSAQRRPAGDRHFRRGRLPIAKWTAKR